MLHNQSPSLSVLREMLCFGNLRKSVVFSRRRVKAEERKKGKVYTLFNFGKTFVLFAGIQWIKK